jgi:TM2 domain-containing membrane protein YozV
MTTSSSDPSVTKTFDGSGLDLYQDQPVYEHKSVGTAVLYSLLLPGLGESYAGNYGMGKFFTISEATLWMTFASFTVYGNWATNDAHSFAALHSGANVANGNDQYFVNIGDYSSIDAYNTEMLRERNLGFTYAPGSASYKANYWKWDSPMNQNQYVNLKIGADGAFTDASFAAIAIAANHIISAIDAARIAINHNKNAEADLLEFHASVISDGYHASGVKLTLTRTF